MAIARVRWQGALFESLQNRHFRWYWTGRLATSAIFEMANVAQGWQVYALTGSAFALGWVGTGWSVTNLLVSPYGGVISDRLEKRQLLFWMKVVEMLNYMAVGVLIATGVIQVWHLATAALVRGALFAVMMPAEQAYIAELVDRKTLLNAVSLSSIGMGLAGIFAASLAGLIIERVGVAGVYLAIVLLYSVILYTISRLPLTGHSDPGGRSIWTDLREGIGYLRVCPILTGLLALGFARGLFLMPYRTFMPKYAQDVMGLDAAGLGILLAAPGVGSLISSLILASLGDFRGKGRMLLSAGIAAGLALVAFANLLSLPPVLVVLGIVGAGSNMGMVMNQALMQVNCEARFKGRVMSAYMMVFGLTQLGSIPFGALADKLGVSWVVLLQGGLFALISVLVLLFVPTIRRLE